MAQGSGGGVGRSTAIVLFTDLVGSTELRSRLGEKAADELRHKHDALVAGAVEAGRGNLVKNLGDGIMATFIGASDAVAAAVAIQQAIGRHNRSSAYANSIGPRRRSSTTKCWPPRSSPLCLGISPGCWPCRSAPQWPPP